MNELSSLFSDNGTPLLIDPEYYIFSTDGNAPYDKSYITRKFKTLLRKLNLSEDLHFHCLRHTYFSNLSRLNVPVNYIKELAGHSSIKTTEIYLPALSVLIIRHSLTPLPCLCHCSTMNLSSVSVQMKVLLSVHLRIRNFFLFRLLILFRIRIRDCIHCRELVLYLLLLIRILHLHSLRTGTFPSDISFRIW